MTMKCDVCEEWFDRFLPQCLSCDKWFCEKCESPSYPADFCKLCQPVKLKSERYEEMYKFKPIERITLECISCQGMVENFDTYCKHCGDYLRVDGATRMPK